MPTWCDISITSKSFDDCELSRRVCVSVNPSRNRSVYILSFLKIIRQNLISYFQLFNSFRTIWSLNPCLLRKAHVKIAAIIIIWQVNSGIPFVTRSRSCINAYLRPPKVQIFSHRKVKKNGKNKKNFPLFAHKNKVIHYLNSRFKQYN